MSKMVVEPRIRGFISLTSHPEGCAANVRRQVDVAKVGGRGEGLGNVLVVGSSQGYGLSTLLTAVFGYGANLLGVCFEKEPTETKTGTAGWYNLVEAHRLAEVEGRQLSTINGDAFSDAVKRTVVRELKERFGPLELLVYSLAAPRRVDAEGVVWNSTLKPLGERYTGKAFDLRHHKVIDAALEPASAEEVASTVKVMGGEDWRDWIELLREEGLLAAGFRTVAYSYIGPEVSAAIYRRGTIGRAKEHLEATGIELNRELSTDGGGAWVSINKGVVTQASSAIPAVPLYISAVFKVMKEREIHEGTIEQIVRLFHDHLAPGKTPRTDDEHRIRLDDLEMLPEVQAAVAERWDSIDDDTLYELTDYAGFRRDFEQLFGFEVDGVDYSAATEVNQALELVVIED
jgi:enoyl-[acyl-carrier protein] reductase/trans-2-enoyl-CoA reductase (NAD+)